MSLVRWPHCPAAGLPTRRRNGNGRPAHGRTPAGRSRCRTTPPRKADGSVPGQRDLPRRAAPFGGEDRADLRSEEHTSELQSRENLVCRLLLEKKKETGRRGGG